MGKGKRNRAERKLTTQTKNDSVSPVLADPKDRHLSAKTQRGIRARLAGSVGEIKAGLAENAEVLWSRIAAFDPRAVVGGIWFQNAPFGSADGAEGHAEGNAAFAEYASMLYAVRGVPAAGEKIVRPELLGQVQEDIEKLFFDTTLLWIAQDIERHGEEPPDAYRSLRFGTLLHTLIVRYSGYHDQERRLLAALHANLPFELADVLGWSIEQAEAVSDAVIEMADERLQSALDRWHAEADIVHDELQKYRKGERGGLKYGSVLGALARLSPKQAEQQVQEMLFVWVLCVLVQEMVEMTVDDVAAKSCVDAEVVKQILDDFSIEPGTQDARYELPTPGSPHTVRPALRLADGKYLFPVPTHFQWAIRPRLEELLNPESQEHRNAEMPRWHSYERIRARITEELALKYLADLMRPGVVERSLKYQYAQGGDTAECELDGLILEDRHLVLIEVKAGGFSPAARRGAPSMSDELDALVGKAHEQALRARDHVLSGTGEFIVASGGRLVIRPEDFDRVVMVTVSLEALEMFVSNLGTLDDFGILAKGDRPWAASLYDLEVVADVLETSAELLDYLERRLDQDRLANVEAHDELDWLGHYLSESLEFPTGRDIILTGFSSVLDAHYLFDYRYQGTRPEKPRRQLPPKTREVLSELDAQRPPGYLEASRSVYAADARTLKKLDALLAKCQTHAEETKPVALRLDMHGLSVVAVAASTLPEAEQLYQDCLGSLDANTLCLGVLVSFENPKARAARVSRP